MCISIELGKKIKLEVDNAPVGMPLFVSILDERDRRSDYWAERIPSDWGIGIRWSKIWDGKARDFDRQEYDVMLDTVSWCHSCECMSHLSRGRCRHVDAAVALLDQGLLATSPRPERSEVA